MGDSLRAQGGLQLGAPGDAELREDPVQVRADRTVRDVELLCDLAVREALGGELRDLELLCGELVAGGGIAATARLAGCAEFSPGPIAPGSAAQCVKAVAGGAQRRPRVGDPSPAAQPFPVREL